MYKFDNTYYNAPIYVIEDCNNNGRSRSYINNIKNTYINITLRTATPVL